MISERVNCVNFIITNCEALCTIVRIGNMQEDTILKTFLRMGCVEKFKYGVSENIYVLNMMKITFYVTGLVLVLFYP